MKRVVAKFNAKMGTPYESKFLKQRVILDEKHSRLDYFIIANRVIRDEDGKDIIVFRRGFGAIVKYGIQFDPEFAGDWTLLETVK